MYTKRTVQNTTERISARVLSVQTVDQMVAISWWGKTAYAYGVQCLAFTWYTTKITCTIARLLWNSPFTRAKNNNRQSEIIKTNI